MSVGIDFLWLEAAYALPVTINATQTVSMQIVTVDQYFIQVTYDYPNGNDPRANENNLLVWSGGPPVPLQAQPVATAPASQGGGSVSPASGTFGSVPYVCAYSVGPYTTGTPPAYPNLAATAYLSGGVGTPLNTITYTSSSLGIQTVQSPLITWTYTFPPGFVPKDNGSWIGLWPGTVVPYNVVPTAAAPIPYPPSSGQAPMDNLTMAGNSQYVGALLTSGYNASKPLLQTTAIAAVVLFSTGAPIVGTKAIARAFRAVEYSRALRANG